MAIVSNLKKLRTIARLFLTAAAIMLLRMQLGSEVTRTLPVAAILVWT